MPKFTSQFVITALAYILAGKFGLLLAIPPGFASAIWPASGAALACYLMLRRTPALLGVLIGSFLINFAHSSGTFTDITPQNSLLALGISIGATLQTAFGGFLFHRFIGDKFHLDRPKEIITFTLFVAPFSCLVASINGTAALLLLSFIHLENAPFSWFTWWTGDSLGAIVLTPLILTVFSTSTMVTRTRKLQLVLPSAMIFLTVLLLFVSSLQVRKNEQTGDLNEIASRYFLRIQEHMTISSNKLKAYEAFYRASSFVSSEEFNLFSITLISDDSAFQAVGWTQIVDHSDRPRVEGEIQAAGFPSFRFTELDSNGKPTIASVREQYYPVLYIYPYEQNKQAHGLNLGVNMSRLEALTRALNERNNIATAPIKLAQNVGDKMGVILYIPVFNSSSDDAATSESDQFLGFISGVFVIDDIVSDVVADSISQDYGINLTDITTPLKPVNIVTSPLVKAVTSPSVNKVLNYGERKYEISVFISEKRLFAVKDWSSWIILTSGFLVAGLLNAFILMLTGTTENIRHEVARKTADLRLAMLAAEKANEAKSNFLANMSHEIRTPLNAIMGLLDICLKTTLTEKQSDYLRKSKMASQTLLSLINQILDYAKIESGKLELEQINFSIVELLEKINAIFSTQASQRSLTFNMVAKGGLASSLIGDPLRIEQILLNLCSNALKFTEKGAITVTVSQQPLAGQQVLLTINIVDTGLGISEQNQNHLFESFRQADVTTTRKYGGTGLGLTIVKELTELMSGTLSVVSCLDEGSTFTVNLPLTLSDQHTVISEQTLMQRFSTTETIAEMDQIQPPETKAPSLDDTAIKLPPSEGKQALDNLKILIVEDNDINQLVAKELFSSEGALITIAPSGAYALNALKLDSTFDIVLLDIQMPEMDGYEVARRIRQFDNDTANIPIVAMTANVSEADKQLCLNAGMDGHIGKPLSISEAVKQILNVIAVRTR